MKPDNILLKAKKELAKGSQKTPIFTGLTPIPRSHSFYQESLWLLSDTIKKEPAELLGAKCNLTAKQKKTFWNKIQKRKQGYPLDYLLGQKFFLNHQFFVQQGVFLPRPETETLVQRVFKQYPKQKPLKIIDAGSGVGTIALSLLSHFPNSQALAVEMHPLSIKYLKKNAQAFKVYDRLQILKKDFSKMNFKDIKFKTSTQSIQNTKPIQDTQSIQDEKKQTNYGSEQNPSTSPVVDLITANPPYIDWKDQDINSGVYWFEPPLALFSDKEGMAHIYLWFKKAMKLLSPKGFYIFELGWKQKEKVVSFLDQQTDLQFYEILKDSVGLPRVAVTQKK